MNNVFINPTVLQEMKLDKIDNTNKKYKYYQKAKDTEIKHYTDEDIKELISSSNLLDIYFRQMKDFDTTILYKSEGHGIHHNIRVCLFAFIISTNEKVNSRDFNLIMEACKYHDIGRENDLEDPCHGKRSADNISFLKDKYTEEELNYIKTIITCHSLNDKEFEKVAIKNKVKDLARCKKMHEILKDSDGLDRVRLHYPFVNIKYLRTSAAKRMIPYAHELFYNYNNILNKSVKEK